MKKNKGIYLVFITLMLFFCYSTNVNAADFNICEKSGIVKSFQLLGHVFYILKIVVPLLLLILGSVDLGKAVISSDDNAIKNSISILIKRAIASVIIFFVPTIISFVVGLVNNTTSLAEFQDCTKCISDPINCNVPKDGGIFDPCVSDPNSEECKGS